MFVGALLLTVFVFLFNDYLKFKNTAHVTSGEVVESVVGKKSDGRIGVVQFIVEYEVNGNKFRHLEDNLTSPPLYSKNDQVEILYDPNTPSIANINSLKSQILPLFFSIMGFLFFILGLTLLTVYLKYYLKKVRLRKQGVPTLATVVGVSVDTSFKKNGLSPYVVRYQFTHKPNGKVYNGSSERIWFDPIVSGHFEVGGKISVLVNMKKPEENTAMLENINKEST